MAENIESPSLTTYFLLKQAGKMKLIAAVWFVQFQPTKDGFAEKAAPQMKARRLCRVLWVVHKDQQRDES